MGLHEILKSGGISHNICTPPFVGISPSIEPETVNTSALKQGPQTALKSPTDRASNIPHPRVSPRCPVCLPLCLSLAISRSFAFPRGLPAREIFMEGITAALMTTCPCSGPVLCHARPSSKPPLVLKGHGANWRLDSAKTSLTAKATHADIECDPLCPERCLWTRLARLPQALQ